MKKSKNKPSVHSLRTKITLLAVCVAVVTITVTTVIGTVSLKRLGDSSSEQLLRLLCETGEKSLDMYFKSVEQSVADVSEHARNDLEKTGGENFKDHVEQVRSFFAQSVQKTRGVLTYYYRIDPEFTDADKGFWYIRTEENNYAEHEVTDISEYDTSDTSSLVWFTVPKTTGKSVWLPPYVTENLNKRVISYNVPVFLGDRFVGVIGIEIDYMTLAAEVGSIKLYKSGYAFVNNSEGTIIYHPYEEFGAAVPENLMSESSSVRYKFNGVLKQAVWLPLENGMRLYVTVPVSEINSGWLRMVVIVIAASLVILALVIVFTLHYTGKVTKPLRDLTEAAEQVDAGNYDVMLKYRENDEVGILSRTFDRLVGHLRIYISDLNSMAHTDALTAVSNKIVYDIHLREIQQTINDQDTAPAFAIVIFDCDDLKLINDRYGHDKGDRYLKNTSAMICHVFQHSPVYRIGGDEFAAVLENGDYENRDELAKLFRKKCEETCADETADWWNQVRVSMGTAVYDPAEDHTVDDVARRADKLMYEDKHLRKVGR